MARWYAVFEKGATPSNSDPISTGTSVDETHLTAQGRTWITIPGDPAGLVWNQSTQQFVTPPPPPNPTTISAYLFAKRFQASEYFAMTQSQDHQIQQFLLEIKLAPRGLIDLTNPDITNGLNYLASKGVLTKARATAIGTP